ncbi:AAA family ATPase [Corallococcus sp. bb12-1]|uniref:ATPase domain-containing protein n=1 Tax=Corallococcus sp. bb12-1 TaxID=2996784 RepID=UPI002271547E|nr:ATPase domain-containing protein [Corallococcus sp. bb12-1]MCY1041275.1 AAA family ATPase [Corallococcus sp. bb12-1]
MMKRIEIPRLQTGVPNLDELFKGGLPKGSVTAVCGPPGSGKTTLTQQICFHNASAAHRVLAFNTLSEPTAKTLRHLQQFSFFDPKKFEQGVQFVDLGAMLRLRSFDAAFALIMDHLKQVKPDIVVIDSFKAFDDLATSKEELRKFGYEIAVNLMAWETTALLLGEYGPADYENKPLFSIVDGLLVLSQRVSQGEQQRFFRIVKMRGTDHSRDEHPFLITSSGLEMFAPREAIKRESIPEKSQERCKTHITKLDELLGPGIPWGSSLLLSGVAGTGKTVLSLEFIYRGALAGEKGILFSFEESEERLRAAAKGLGWELDREIDRGMVEIVFIPQPDIMVEAHLLMIRERIKAMKARRVVIDSVSVFLDKVTDPQLSREKVFHLCSIVQNAQAVGFFPTDIPYGSHQVSRRGVEETVVDGVIILSSTEEGLERERYVEVYKLRNTAHLKGRHAMAIGAGGVSIFPRYGEEPRVESPPPALEASTRLGSGTPGLDGLLGGGLLRRSATLVSGSAGVGKSLFGIQFLLEGARAREPGLYVSMEEGPEQLLASAEALGLPLRAQLDAGLIQVLYVSREHLRAGQFLTVLSDQLKALKASRVVLDAATQLLTAHTSIDEFRHVLYKLVVRFKTLGITSVLTLESSSLSSMERVTDQGLSPIADNLLMLRYREASGRLAPTLTVVKTRGSGHDRRTHFMTVEQGGLRIGSSVSEFLAPPSASPEDTKHVSQLEDTRRG